MTAAGLDPDPAATRVAAIVVAWNSADHLAPCLASLDAQDHPVLDVIVVDNASSDATPQSLRAALDRPRRHHLEVVWNATNRGFCGGVNDAMARLAPDVAAVLLVNPDVVLEPDLTRRCVSALQADPRRGSVQPRVLRTVRAPDGQLVLDGTGHVFTRARLFRNRGEGERDQGQYASAGEVFGASGALVLHRRAMLEDIAWRRSDGSAEYLTEDLFAYFDDVEVDWRARLRGWTAWYEPAATATHERGGAGPRRTPLVEALNLTNRGLVIVTCDDLGSLLRASPLVAATSLLKVVELVLTEPRAVLPALRRVGLLRGALQRRRLLRSRVIVPRAEVVARHVEHFSWRSWVRTWWLRVRGRALGVAR